LNFYYDYYQTFTHDYNPDELAENMTSILTRGLENAPLRVSIQQASAYLAALHDCRDEMDLTPGMYESFRTILAALREKLTQLEAAMEADQ